MKIHKEQPKSEYYVKVKVARYASESHTLTLMHGNNTLERYHNYTCSLQTLPKLINRVVTGWEQWKGNRNLDVLIEDTPFGNALLDMMKNMESTWQNGAPSLDGYFFSAVNVDDVINVEILQGTPVHVDSVSYDKVTSAGTRYRIQNIYGTDVNASLIKYHQHISSPTDFVKGSPQEDGWYFIKRDGIVELGYSYKGIVTDNRYIKTFSGSIYYMTDLISHSPIQLPEPPK